MLTGIVQSFNGSSISDQVPTASPNRLHSTWSIYVHYSGMQKLTVDVFKVVGKRNGIIAKVVKVKDQNSCSHVSTKLFDPGPNVIPSESGRFLRDVEIRRYITQGEGKLWGSDMRR